MSSYHRLFGLLAVSAVACSPDASLPGGAGSNLNGGPPLPCQIQTILQNNCGDCHGSQPHGAPMPLATYNDVHALINDTRNPPQDNTQMEVWRRIGERINATSNQMPQGDRLNPADLQMMNSWLQQGAPAGQACQGQIPPQGSGGGIPMGTGGGYVASGGYGGSGGAVASGGMGGYVATGGVGGAGGAGSGGQPIDDGQCVDIDIRARADATGAPMPVPAGTSELYECFSYHIPMNGVKQGLSFKNLPGNGDVIHHWLLYAMSTPQSDGVKSPCLGAHADGLLIAGWAPGGDDWIMPPDVGLELPASGDFILEVHYNNYSKVNTTDNSGVRICGAKTARKNTASISWLGNDLFTIPGSTPLAPDRRGLHAVDHEPIHVITSWPHMHKRGRSMNVEVHRVGGAVDKILDNQPFDFNLQKQYQTNYLVNPGDSVWTTCNFENKDPGAVTFGEETFKEMCFNFTVAYPAHKLIQAGANQFIHADECVVLQ